MDLIPGLDPGACGFDSGLIPDPWTWFLVESLVHVGS